jgi:stress response protein SCP2/regulator of protease activity HflC (stomatin/prohibitin superfamily)
MDLQQGGNARLSSRRIRVLVQFSPQPGCEFNVSAFLLNSQNRVRGDHDMVFYNQRTAASGAVSLVDCDHSGASFDIDLSRLPEEIERISFCTTVGQAGHSDTLASLSNAKIEVWQDVTLAASFAPPLSGVTEKAMTFGEVYRRGPDWKFRAVGQGFRGGLDRLAKEFGVDIADEPQRESVSRPSSKPKPYAPPPDRGSLHPMSKAEPGDLLVSESRPIELVPRPAPDDPFPNLVPAEQTDTGLSRAFKILLACWGAAVALMLLLSVIGVGIIGILLWLVATIFLGIQAFELIGAKSRVLRSPEVEILKGYGRLVSWNPNEGVVFLKNKNLAFYTQGYGTSGGICTILPFLGEEVAYRTSISTRQIDYDDKHVFSREHIPVIVRTKMYWKVSNPARFYLRFGRDAQHAHDNHHHHGIADGKEDAARLFIVSIAEEETRIVISQISAGLLISDRLLKEMNGLNRPDIAELSRSLSGGSNLRDISSILLDYLQDRYNAHLIPYGIEIERVALQEMSLQPDMYQAMQNAVRQAMVSADVATAMARARKIQLETDANVIGKDAVALREIASNLPALAFQDLVSPFLSQFAKDKRLR